MTLSRYSFAPRGEFPTHVHPQEQLTFVLDGAVRFTVGSREYDSSAQSVVVIPANVEHRGHSKSGAEMICVVSPSRRGGSGIEILGEHEFPITGDV